MLLETQDVGCEGEETEVMLQTGTQMGYVPWISLIPGPVALFRCVWSLLRLCVASIVNKSDSPSPYSALQFSNVTSSIPSPSYQLPFTSFCCVFFFLFDFLHLKTPALEVAHAEKGRKDS